MSRAMLLLALVGAGAGCAATRAQFLRSRQLREQFERARFQLPLARAAAVVEAELQPPAAKKPGTPREQELHIEEQRCRERVCRFKLARDHERAVLDVAQADEEQVGFRLQGSDSATEAEVTRRVWTALDRVGYVRASRDSELEAVPPFTGRFSATAALTLGLGQVYGLGGRLGLRRWHRPWLLTRYLLDYERSYVGGPEGTAGYGHLLSAMAGLEVAPYTDWTDRRHGIPEYSFYLMGGPRFCLDNNPLPGTGYGWVGALGAHLTNYTGAFSFPLILELQVHQLFFSERRATGARFVTGIAF